MGGKGSGRKPGFKQPQTKEQVRKRVAGQKAGIARRKRLVEIGETIERLDKDFQGSLTDALLAIGEAKADHKNRVERTRKEFGDKAANEIDRVLGLPATDIVALLVGKGSVGRGRRKVEDTLLAFSKAKEAVDVGKRLEQKLDRLLEIKESEAEGQRQRERRLSESMHRATRSAEREDKSLRGTKVPGQEDTRSQWEKMCGDMKPIKGD